MQRNHAIERLSPIHALALRLDALGADRELVATCLGVAPETVGPLLEVAAAKLARAEQDLAGGQDAEASQRIGSGEDRAPKQSTSAAEERRSVSSGGREGGPEENVR